MESHQLSRKICSPLRSCDSNAPFLPSNKLSEHEERSVACLHYVQKCIDMRNDMRALPLHGVFNECTNVQAVG